MLNKLQRSLLLIGLIVVISAGSSYQLPSRYYSAQYYNFQNLFPSQTSQQYGITPLSNSNHVVGYSNSMPTILNDVVPQATSTFSDPAMMLENTCEIGTVQPIWENDVISETYCRCPNNAYGLTCTENFANPCGTQDSQFFQADPVFKNKYFIHCENMVPYLKKCPGNLFWNEASKSCDFTADFYAKYGVPSMDVVSQQPAYGGAAYSSYSAPAPVQSFSAPTQSFATQTPKQTYSSYSAPAPAPVQSFSAPTQSFATQTPKQTYSSYSAPAPAPVQSFSAPTQSFTTQTPKQTYSSYSAPAPAPVQSFSAQPVQSFSAPTYSAAKPY